MNAWQLALIVSVLALTVGYFMQTPEPKPCSTSIDVHGAPPEERVITESP